MLKAIARYEEDAIEPARSLDAHRQVSIDATAEGSPQFDVRGVEGVHIHVGIADQPETAAVVRVIS